MLYDPRIDKRAKARERLVAVLDKMAEAFSGDYGWCQYAPSRPNDKQVAICATKAVCLFASNRQERNSVYRLLVEAIPHRTRRRIVCGRGYTTDFGMLLFYNDSAGTNLFAIRELIATARANAAAQSGVGWSKNAGAAVVAG